MHAGIRVSVGKFQEVVAIEIGHLFTQPLVLQFIEIAVFSIMQLILAQFRMNFLREVVELSRYFLQL